MYVRTVTEIVPLTNASAAVTLQRRAVRAVKAQYWTDAGASAAAAMNARTFVTGAPGATEVQFTGTPGSPSASMTLGANAATGDLLIVEYEPEGAVGAAA